VREDIIKQKAKERYGKIALVGRSSEGCCAPTEYCNDGSNNDSPMMSPLQIAENISYDINDFEFYSKVLYSKIRLFLFLHS
jgi:hypothetical protein